MRTRRTFAITLAAVAAAVAGVLLALSPVADTGAAAGGTGPATAGTGTAAVASTRAAARADLAVAKAFLAHELTVYGRQYANGDWRGAQAGCWGCAEGGPMTAAATYYVISGDRTALTRAVATVNRAISANQLRSGAFTARSSEQSQQITTMFFADELGETYLLLHNHVPISTARRWRTALLAAASYMISSGASSWYANGNINLGISELEWMAWAASGQQRFRNAYDSAWTTLTTPNQTEFPGCGWITVVEPTTATANDGTGYFAETGDGGTGYDPYYSMLQLDVAARLYLISGDSRALRVANMLVNQEDTRVSTTNWMINVSGGTRHTAANTFQGFQTSAYTVLSLLGGRSDLHSHVIPELRRDLTWFGEPGQANSAVFRRAISTSVATAALAAWVAANGHQRPFASLAH